MFDYKVYADNGSMYNTPPTYAIYLAGLVFQNLEKNGGVAAVEEVNKRKLHCFMTTSIPPNSSRAAPEKRAAPG